MSRKMMPALVTLLLVAVVAVPGCRDRDPEFLAEDGAFAELVPHEEVPGDEDPGAVENEGEEAQGEDGNGAEAEAAEGQTETARAPSQARQEPRENREARSAPTAPAPSANAPREGQAAATPRTGDTAREGRQRPEGGGRPDGERPERRDIFERFDANNDGVLTADELPERMRERIMAADANGDGRITRAEYEAVRDTLRREAAARGDGGPRPERGEGGERGERRDPAERARALFDRLDANGDGKLTADEIPEEFVELFRMADANGDGVVTRAEFEAVGREMAPRGPRGSE